MDYTRLRNELKGKLYFDVEDLHDILKIKPASVCVLCNRYAKNGLFIRIKRNFYTLRENWEGFGKEDLFKIANALQVPSYISFMTALSFYEVTTQVQKSFYESASLKRTVKNTVKGTVFNYCKLKRQYYFDFNNVNGLFIATKEKAFIDALYLCSFGKYKFDIDSIDLARLDKARLRNLLKRFPSKTKILARKICKI